VVEAVDGASLVERTRSLRVHSVERPEFSGVGSVTELRRRGFDDDDVGDPGELGPRETDGM
jgi:hypothetical protein